MYVYAYTYSTQLKFSSRYAHFVLDIPQVLHGIYIPWVSHCAPWPGPDNGVARLADADARLLHLVRHGQATHNVALAKGEVPKEESRRLPWDDLLGKATDMWCWKIYPLEICYIAIDNGYL